MTFFNSSPPAMLCVIEPRWFTIFDFFNTFSMSASARPQSFMRLIRYRLVFPSSDSFDAPINLANSPRYMFPCFLIAVSTSSSRTSDGTLTRIAKLLFDHQRLYRVSALTTKARIIWDGVEKTACYLPLTNPVSLTKGYLAFHILGLDLRESS